MNEIEWADLASENQRLRERVAELERETGYSDQRLVGIYDRATKAERERDEALHALELVREELTGADADWPSEAAEAQMVARVVKERDAARAEAAMLREELKEWARAVGDFRSGVGGSAWADAADTKLLTFFRANVTSGDWLAARDRALAERVREVVLAQIAKGRTPNAIDIDALVGGKS